MAIKQLSIGIDADTAEAIHAAVIEEREACVLLAERVIECHHEHGDNCGCDLPLHVSPSDIPGLIRERK